MTDRLMCPICGAALPTDAMRGLCPRCLLREVLDDASDTSCFASDVATPRSGSVLDTLSAAVGHLPCVLLPETVPNDQSSASEMPPPSNRSGRYQLFGEIGRGGMGAILRGRDPDLGRELAMKVLLDRHKDEPELVRRFVEEAQIGGQLQHPGIIPVYEFGAFADARPYFTMKLVKGRTLNALLGDRKDPADDRPRFLSIFEAIAQTVAYAHARGVIHRDLKPSNVMVGGFGEVQVMDWGLAKVLRRGGVIVEDNERPEPESISVIRTVRTGSDADDSRAGSVVGTPAYMAPEQAAADASLVDERADVFGLGAMLSEILSGAPPYTGRSLAEVMRQATQGDTSRACARLDASGADSELIVLAKECLAVDPLDRPGDAGDVARRITAYLAGVQERLHSAERERAVAEARAVEESKRRRVTLALAVSVLALVVVGGGGAAWYSRYRERQAAQVSLLTREAHLLRDQARAQGDDPVRWLAAREAVKRVEVALGDAPNPAARKTLDRLRAEVRSGLERAEADRLLLERLVDIRSASAEDLDGSATEAAYAAAFGSVGIDVDEQSPADAGARIAGRPGFVTRSLVAALDHWTAVRRGFGTNGPGWAKLLAAARVADPDPDRDALRAALLVSDRAERLERLRPLARRAGVELWAPASLVLLGDALAGGGDVDAAVAVLRRASGAHPGDAWVHYDLAQLLDRLRPSRPEQAIAAYMAARAVRPETAHALAHALVLRGRDEEAEAIFRDLTLRRPANARHLTCFGSLLKDRGQDREATAVLARAITAGRAAIRLKPDDGQAHLNLGKALQAQGKLDEAIAEYRVVIRLTPGLTAINNLGNALQAQGKLDEAVAVYQVAIRLKPDAAEEHHNLGDALKAQGKLVEAMAEYHVAIRLDPDRAEPHSGLGFALSDLGKYDEAIAEYREAIRLKPDDASGHYNLGIVLNAQGRPDEAVAEFRATIRLRADSPKAHCNLGLLLLRRSEDSTEALALLRRGHELGSKRPDWPYRSAQWVKAAEGLAMARMCMTKGLCGAAARLYAVVFAFDPKLAEGLKAGHRYNAACAAALAGCGQGKDDPPPDAAAQAALRHQSREWLKADLTAQVERLDSGSDAAREEVRKAISFWKSDPNLEGVRAPEALANLPEEEQEAWRSLWSDVDALRTKAHGDRP